MHCFCLGTRKTTGSDMLQFDETTISASTVSGKELMKRSNINPANALYGKLNGLFIRQTESMGMEKDIQA